MADATAKITVSVEKAIHDGLADVLQEIADKHDVCVENVEVDWALYSASDPSSHRCASLSVRTTTRIPWNR